MGGKPPVRLEGIMDGIMRQIQEERLSGGNGRIDLRQGLQGQCLRQERLRPVVFLQPWYGPGTDAPDEPIAVFAQIAAGLADGGAGHIDLETQVPRIRAFALERSEMSLAHMDGPVAGRLQDAGERDVVAVQSFPVPLVRPIVVAVVLLAADPVRRPVPRGILSGQEGCPGRGAHALRIELGEPRALPGEPFHVRSPVPVVERIPYRKSLIVSEEGDRRVHQAHVVHQEQDDVRLLLAPGAESGPEQAE